MHAPQHPQHTARSVLILDQGMLKAHGGRPMHGVELFRLALARDLVRRGVRVTLAVERSWKPRVEHHLADDAPRIITTPNLGGVAINALVASFAAAGDEFDVALLGNARRGMIPAIYAVSLAGIARRLLLFAHRAPGAHFIEAVSALDFDVVAVSEFVAHWYRGYVSGSVDVCYGIAHAEHFTPRAQPKPDDAPIDFVLLGKLPSVSKGQRRALEAFAALPPDLRDRCRLHLASFAEPPDDLPPNVVAHPWMPVDRVGELLREMDVMLALSTRETFSQAIVQGMLAGLPVIASPLPVYEEKLDTGGGVVARTTAEVADAMASLARDPRRRRAMGAAGRETALQRYVWDTDVFIRRHLFPENAPAD